MEDEDNFEEAYGPLLVPQEKLSPLCIEEDDEEYFEDCLDEIGAALALPGDSMSYSQTCQETLHTEFNALMRHMLAQLDDFDATHETKSTLTEYEDILIRNGFQDMSKYEGFDAETAESMAGDESVLSPVEAPELSASMVIKDVGTRFESCIEEVSKLERRRDELVKELLELEQPMEKEVQALRTELGESQKLLSTAMLQKQSLQDEMRLLKRRLFAAANECAQMQMALARQQKEVEQLNKEEEEMKTHVTTLTEVIAQLQSEHQSQLQALQGQQKDNISQEFSKDTTHSYLSQGRQASMDVLQYLQGGIKALEEWYEPRLVALLKRRQSSAEALSKYKEQCQELKTQLVPLKHEEQRLGLERARLEERMLLMEQQRKENLEHYRSTIDLLEENSRELKTELQIQKNKIKEMEDLKNSLAKQLYYYRERAEEQHTQQILLKEEKT